MNGLKPDRRRNKHPEIIKTAEITKAVTGDIFFEARGRYMVLFIEASGSLSVYWFRAAEPHVSSRIPGTSKTKSHPGWLL